MAQKRRRVLTFFPVVFDTVGARVAATVGGAAMAAMGESSALICAFKLRKHVRFLSFPYGCPEPVLAKARCFGMTWRKMYVFVPLRLLQRRHGALQKTRLFVSILPMFVPSLSW